MGNITSKKTPLKKYKYLIYLYSTVLTVGSITAMIYIPFYLSTHYTSSENLMTGTVPMEMGTVYNATGPILGQIADPICDSPISGDACWDSTKCTLESSYGVEINYMHDTSPEKQPLYQNIIEIANLIVAGTDDLGRSELDKINDKGVGRFVIRNIRDYIVLKVKINGQNYILKRLSKMELWNSHDMLAVEFDSPYITKILMSFKCGDEEWILSEYAGERICAGKYPYFCTDDEIRPLIHDLLHGIAHINERGYEHMDMHRDNIMKTIDSNGKTTGYKIIDFGVAQKIADRSVLMMRDLIVITDLIKDHFWRRFTERSLTEAYKVAIDHNNEAQMYFKEGEEELVDLIFTILGYVSKPPVSAAELLLHPYVLNKKVTPSPFGEPLYSVQTIVPSPSSNQSPAADKPTIVI